MITITCSTQYVWSCLHPPADLWLVYAPFRSHLGLQLRTHIVLYLYLVGVVNTFVEKFVQFFIYFRVIRHLEILKYKRTDKNVDYFRMKVYNTSNLSLLGMSPAYTSWSCGTSTWPVMSCGLVHYFYFLPAINIPLTLLTYRHIVPVKDVLRYIY